MRRCPTLPPHVVRRVTRMFLSVACLGMTAAAAVAQTRVPDWELRGRVETRPLSPGECAFVAVFLKDANGRLIRRPDGNTIGAGDVELALSGPGAASFKWERNTPNWYKVCATFAAGPDRADIIVTYPRMALPDEEVYPGVAFSAVLPVFRGSGGGTPDFSLLKLQDVGGVVAGAPAAAQPAVALPDPNRPLTQTGTVQTPPNAPPRPAVALPDPNLPPTSSGTVQSPPPAPPASSMPASGAGLPPAPGAGGSVVAAPPAGPPPPVGTPPQPSGSVPPPLAPGTPRPPGPSPAPPPPVASTPGKYLIRLVGIRANRQTFDDPLNRDGWGDEIFAATFVTLINRTTLVIREKTLLTTKTYGSPGNFPNREAVEGGIVTGTTLPSNLDVMLNTPGPGTSDRFPQQLFSGVLDTSAAILIAPSLWEWDGDAKAFQFWRTNQGLVNAGPLMTGPVINNETTRAAIATGDAQWRQLSPCVVGVLSSATDTYTYTPANMIRVNAGEDRPLLNRRIEWCQPYVALTRDAIERLLNQSVGALPRGVIELRIVESNDYATLSGDYSLFLRIDRLP